MELQVEEDPEPKARELFDRSRSFGREKLASYFEDSCRPSEPARQNAGRPQAVNIQGDD